MNAPSRTFQASPAVREQVPIMIGLMGPSGGGKTYSALRLARGIQQVVGGKIYMVDTEQRRGLHYADDFKNADGSPGYDHIPFAAPFGSLDYLAVLEFCVKAGAKTIIVDSMSHEHEGVGGLIDLQDQEMRRLAKDEYGTRGADRFNMMAWQLPKKNRRILINRLLQLDANFIFCFRAKETSKPKKVADERTGRTKTEIVQMGFMPIAGDEFVFEMTMNALLLPHADGVPTWNSENIGERMMMKLPSQFRGLMQKPRPLDEQMGADLAKWARGGAGTPATRSEPADRSDGDFPGDRSHSSTRTPSSANNGGGDGGALPLSTRIEQFYKRMGEASSAVKATAIWNVATALRTDVDAKDPERLPEMEAFYEEKLAALEEAERAGGSD